MGSGLPATEQAGKAPLVDGHAGPGRTIGLWVSGESLLWWTKNGRIAPVVTAGGSGVLGSAGTRVLVDNLDFDNDVRPGARFALGYNFVKDPLVGIEAGYFFLAERQSEVSFSSAVVRSSRNPSPMPCWESLTPRLWRPPRLPVAK
jgi:hypothetical protein